MFDQSTVIELLRQISSKLDTVVANQSSLLALNETLDHLIILGTVSFAIAAFVFILKGWLKK